MQAGRLRHRVQIQSKPANQQDRDPAGGVAEVWTTEATRWAAVEPLRGKELLEAHMVDGRLTHKVTMRHYEGLTAAHRLLFGTRVLNVLMPPMNPEERGIETTTLCMEDV
jgi:SPP1 family predicted phage head-tail adaptor